MSANIEEVKAAPLLVKLRRKATRPSSAGCLIRLHTGADMSPTVIAEARSDIALLPSVLCFQLLATCSLSLFKS